MPASITRILDVLEAHYGIQKPSWPTDPYRFLVWWHCGYPPGDAACAKGWASLTKSIGVDPPHLIAASPAKLTKALTPGGLIPELRATRLKQIATRIQEEFAGDLCTALAMPIPQLRKTLGKFPGIAGPGTDRILLFGGVAPVAAVPSNCPHVLVRIQHGPEQPKYADNYRKAQETIDAEVSATIEARARAYLLLKRHGQELCKSSRPACSACPAQALCAYANKSA